MSENKGPRKNVLVIANLFHASPRIPRILKHLTPLEWSSTVITPNIEGRMENIFNAPPKEIEEIGIRVVEAGTGRPYESVKEDSSVAAYGGLGRKVANKMDGSSNGRTSRMMEKYYWRLYLTRNYPDVERKWKADAMDAAERILQTEKFDLILSSSSPIITHIICSEIKRKHGIPWIAEYRDLWSMNYNYQLGRIMRYFDRRLERKTMATADALVTVTDILANELRGMFPEKRVLSIPTGFDRDESPDIPPLTNEFTITYTGQYYRGKQDPLKVLKAVGELIAEKRMDEKRVRIRFFGPPDEIVQKYAETTGLAGMISQPGVVSREEAQKRQKESQLLLYMNWEDPEQKGALPLKLIEYLSAGRPILLSGGVADNLMAGVVRRTGAGVVAVSETEIKRSMGEMYSQFVATGSVPFRGNREEIEKYDVRNSSIKYAELMNSIVEKRIP